MSSVAFYDEFASDGRERTKFFGLVLQHIGNPKSGLPEDVFEFALSVTPMINVDLLISNSHSVLLAWREDDWGRGWHVPGGIIRFNEPISHRISEVARLELGTTVDANLTPVAISQFFAVRGHFISLLYRCTISGEAARPMAARIEHPRPGELAWFKSPPVELYPAHIDYIPRFAEFGASNVLTLAEPPIVLS